MRGGEGDFVAPTLHSFAALRGLRGPAPLSFGALEFQCSSGNLLVNGRVEVTLHIQNHRDDLPWKCEGVFSWAIPQNGSSD